MILDYGDIFFTFCFTVEFFIKAIAMGFYYGPGAFTGSKEPGPYWKFGWNRLDGSLVVIGVFNSATKFVGAGGGGAMSLLRLLRILRALRPLRSLKYFPSIMLIFEGVASAVGPLLQMLMLASVVFLVLAILGVQMFGGKLYYCDTTGLELPRDVNGTVIPVESRADCPAPERWINGLTLTLTLTLTLILTLTLTLIGGGSTGSSTSITSSTASCPSL